MSNYFFVIYLCNSLITFTKGVIHKSEKNLERIKKTGMKSIKAKLKKTMTDKHRMIALNVYY